MKDDNSIPCRLKIQRNWWRADDADSRFPFPLRCGSNLILAAVALDHKFDYWMSLLLIWRILCLALWKKQKRTPFRELKEGGKLWNVSHFLLVPAVWTISFLVSADRRAALTWCAEAVVGKLQMTLFLSSPSVFFFLPDRIIEVTGLFFSLSDFKIPHIYRCTCMSSTDTLLLVMPHKHLDD